MTDRNVQYPYRFHVRPVPGTDDICEIIPAPGTVYEDGTFWNKQNVLKDATAALYGKTAAAVPDEIFAAIGPDLSMLKAQIGNKIMCAYGSYVGTGDNIEGYPNPKTITFPFTPKVVFVSVDKSTGNRFGGTPALVRGSSLVMVDGAGYITKMDISWGNNSVTLTGWANTEGYTFFYVGFG